MSETLSCYKWTLDTGDETLWGHEYPAGAEQFEDHEVSILFWESGRDE